MGQLEIQDKLQKFLGHEPPFLEEKDVVYFLVEARKMIQHNNSQNFFPAIKFYADWAFHIRKDYAPSIIQGLVQESTGKLEDFVNMNYLMQEIKEFIDLYKLPKTMIENRANWKIFWQKLIRVLSEQPLILKGPISKFEFRTSTDENMIEFDYEM